MVRAILAGTKSQTRRAHLRYRGYTAWARRTGDGMIFDATGAVVHRVFRTMMEDTIAAIEDYLTERAGA